MPEPDGGGHGQDTRTDDYHFDLPPGQIAERPAGHRDEARLLTLDRDHGTVDHRQITDLPTLLAPGDLLVLNDTRVFPARIHGRKQPHGGRVELLLLRPEGRGDADPTARWRALARGRVRAGQDLVLDGNLTVTIHALLGDGEVVVDGHGVDMLAYLEQHGTIPLPPYIHRPADAVDRARYQTIFARETGSVAAPTAGLHLTTGLLTALANAGIGTVPITLHVGPGTFLPVRTENLNDHVMHGEMFHVEPSTVAAIQATRARGGRVIACGTTVARALESAAALGELAPCRGETRLFIRPGFSFRVVDGLLTNFHLPGSTLLMLVAALAGREPVLAAYARAVAEGYRFYSYGDAMLVQSRPDRA